MRKIAIDTFYSVCIMHFSLIVLKFGSFGPQFSGKNFTFLNESCARKLSHKDLFSFWLFSLREFNASIKTI